MGKRSLRSIHTKNKELDFESRDFQDLFRAGMRYYGMLTRTELKDFLHTYLPKCQYAEEAFSAWFDANQGRQFGYVPQDALLVNSDFMQCLVQTLGNESKEYGHVQFSGNAAKMLQNLRDERNKYGRNFIPLSKLLAYADEDFATNLPFAKPMRRLFEAHPELIEGLGRNDMRSAMRFCYIYSQLEGGVNVSLEQILCLAGAAKGKFAQEIRDAYHEYNAQIPQWSLGGQSIHETIESDIGPGAQLRSIIEFMESIPTSDESFAKNLRMMYRNDHDLFVYTGRYLKDPKRIAIWEQVKNEMEGKGKGPKAHEE